MQADTRVRFGRTDLSVTAFGFGFGTAPSFIVGTRTVEQLRKNLAWFCHPIPADFWAELKAAGLLREDAPVPLTQDDRRSREDGTDQGRTT